MRKQSEAFFWSLFSAGGVLAALFMPVFIIVTGLALPFLSEGFGEFQYDRVIRILSFWPVRIFLFGIISFSLFHCAHRIRHILIDIGIRLPHAIQDSICYILALLGSIVAAVLLVSL